jgi:predicted molibdopterin-dependent oxidoreductase YjgC
MADHDTITVTIDDQQAVVPPGTTILEAASQLGIAIPTLCYHEELTPPAVCRICVVEVENARVLQPACATAVVEGMVVHTRSERVVAARRTVLEMLASAVDLSKAPDILAMLEEYDVDASRFAGGRRRDYTVEDDNPFYVRDYSQCVMCWRCVIVCSEVVGASAINFGERGFGSHIAAPFDGPMIESDCVFCGSCVQVCPTEALMSATRPGKGREHEVDRVRTICSYCGVGCSIEYALQVNGDGNRTILSAEGYPEAVVNNEFLCVKGRYGWDFVNHPDRLTTPLIRRDLARELGLTQEAWTLPDTSPLAIEHPNIEDSFIPVDWDTALDVVATKLAETVKAHGPDAVMGLSSARCTNEENYLFQKLMRLGIGTNNVDHCARL